MGVLPAYFLPLCDKYSFMAVCAGIDSSRLRICPKSFHLWYLMVSLIGLFWQRSYSASFDILSGQYIPNIVLRCFLCSAFNFSKFDFVSPHVPQL